MSTHYVSNAKRSDNLGVPFAVRRSSGTEITTVFAGKTNAMLCHVWRKVGRRWERSSEGRAVIVSHKLAAVWESADALTTDLPDGASAYNCRCRRTTSCRDRRAATAFVGLDRRWAGADSHDTLAFANLPKLRTTAASEIPAESANSFLLQPEIFARLSNHWPPHCWHLTVSPIRMSSAPFAPQSAQGFGSLIPAVYAYNRGNP